VRAAAAVPPLLAASLALGGCLPALTTMETARTLRPDEGQAWIAVEPSGAGTEPGKGATRRLMGLQQIQVGVREGITDRWETGVRFSPAGIEWEQKLQLARSPIDVGGVDVALATGIGGAIWALNEWDDVVMIRARAELPIGLRLADTSQILLTPRAIFLRIMPAPEVELSPASALLVGGSVAFAWRLSAGYLVPELTALLTVAGPGEGSPLHRSPVVLRAGVGFLFGG